ncbi:ABC transporter substrate-binding protein [Actinomadura parmotrematis]|uniref:Extracellular solute-binding protein n=1 Tax=Actinomadura parmotrematis TaxID=2864039 RepID=A0ABS7G2Z9_9ACTN|nr:extracellular solute-binding protein [Actinomadura parmotrematis]MBW8486730.1 extracellular solute-binding protein [Actinomadura parmotrematis]
MRLDFGRRRLLAAAAITALAAPLAACGSGSGDGSGGGSADAITMWTFKAAHVKPLEEAAARFKAQSGVTVKVQAITPDDAYTAKLQSAAKTKGLPDVLEVHTLGEDLTYGGAGMLSDLTGKVDASWSGQYVQNVRTAGTVTPELETASKQPGSAYPGIKAGARYSVPFTIGAFGVVYANKTMLADAGVKDTPKTWEDLIAALKATTAKSKDAGGITVGLAAPSTGLNWMLHQLSYGTLGKDGYHGLFAKGAHGWNSADGKRVLSLYDQLTPYWTPGSQSLKIDDADRAFAQKRAAFDIGGTFTLAGLEQFGMKADDVAAFAVPAPKDGKAAGTGLAPFSLTSLSVTTQSKNPDAALKWLRFLSQKDTAAAFAKAATDIPAADLGADASAAGTAIGALSKTLSTGADAYDSSDHSFMPAQYTSNIDKLGALLTNMSPLKQASVDQTAKRFDELVTEYWNAEK